MSPPPGTGPMKGKVTVVGSGPSGVHFALTLLKRGFAVEMIDSGEAGEPSPAPDVDFSALKGAIDDPAAYLLGSDFSSVVLPGSKGAYYGFPPSKDYVFRTPEAAGRSTTTGFSPLTSYARGGLAEAWTAGAYPFNDGELADFPIPPGALRPYYEEVAARIGISGENDDLSEFYPEIGAMQPPLELDSHSVAIMQRYERDREYLNKKLGCRAGRSRIATLSRALGERPECRYCGRCFWGCPQRSLYTPSITLDECMKYEHFTYRPGYVVTRFETDGSGNVSSISAVPASAGEPRSFSVETLALAAGTLSSSRIYLDSVRAARGEVIRLTGLMDNRQLLVPFINMRMIGTPARVDAYQYNQLAMGFGAPDPRDYIHVMITTLKSALLHPIIQSLPFDLGTSVSLFRYLHAALGLANVNLPDTRRESNYLTIEPRDGDAPSRLVINYSPDRGEDKRIENALKKVRAALRRLSCIAPKSMTHVRPMGASVHYAGTVPMAEDDAPHTVTPECRSREFPNLFMVDGATFPFLPAKNYTFTLMANAVRVATEAF